MNRYVEYDVNKAITPICVSIIIPVYNGRKLLKRCLNSVTNQLSDEIEVICVNDGSTDGSGKICDVYAKHDSRIQVLHLVHKGVSVARNAGMAAAKGKYLFFLDADDRLAPGAVSALISYSRRKVDFVIGAYTECRNGIKYTVHREVRNYTASSIRKNFGKFDGMLSMLHAKLYKRSIIMKNNIRFLEELPYGEDHIFNIDYSRCVANCMVTNQVLYMYSLGGTASSATYYENMALICQKLLHSYSYIVETPLDTPNGFYKIKVRDQLLGCIEHYVTFCTYDEALHKIEESLEVFEPYLREDYIDKDNYASGLDKSILKRDLKRIYRQVFRQKWFRIYLRRARCRRRKRVL